MKMKREKLLEAYVQPTVMYMDLDCESLLCAYSFEAQTDLTETEEQESGYLDGGDITGDFD